MVHSKNNVKGVVVFGQNIMFGLFKRSSPIDKLKKQAQQLEEEAYRLSHTDRKAADAKTAEAAVLWKEIENLQR